MITRFEFTRLPDMLLFISLHRRVNKSAERMCDGLLGVSTLKYWQTLTVLSISVWRNLDSVYQMGDVPLHITASRWPAQRGTVTRCGVYPYSGDWKWVMFKAGTKGKSPTEDLVK